MLVLTRRKDEQIFINKGQIKIKVLHVKKDFVTIGVKVPVAIDVAPEEAIIRNPNMLVLTRRMGEQIFIDKGQIEVKVLYTNGRSVAIGIKAPTTMDVDREELFIRKQTNPNFIKNSNHTRSPAHSKGTLSDYLAGFRMKRKCRDDVLFNKTI